MIKEKMKVKTMGEALANGEKGICLRCGWTFNKKDKEDFCCKKCKRKIDRKYNPKVNFIS